MEKVVERIRVMIVPSRESAKPVRTGIKIILIRKTYLSDCFVEKKKKRDVNSFQRMEMQKIREKKMKLPIKKKRICLF